ncbi:hypothetical protein C2G38_2082636, partial [Gigaspora rosea]
AYYLYFYLLIKNCLFNFLLKNPTIFFYNHFILSILYEFKLLHRVDYFFAKLVFIL